MGTVYLGIDFHATKIVTHRIERMADGKIMRSNGSFFPEEISRFIPTLKGETYVCVEASSGVFEFCEKIESHVSKIFVIHPMGFRRMYLSGKKTDRIDAKKLAERMKVHIEDGDADDDFPSVWIPPRAIRELRDMFSCLDLIKKQINMLKNKIRSILRQYLNAMASNVVLEVMNPDEFEIPDHARFMVRGIQALLHNALLMKKQLEDRIKQAAIAYNEFTIRLLLTIYGVSVMSASAILSDVGCIERFASAKKFARYMRSAPKVNSSNDTTRIGSIDKAGRKTAFGYLVEGLYNIYGGNPGFSKFYKEKTKCKSKCRVRAALVRKTLVTIYYMWKNREEYRFKHEAVTLRKLKEVERIKKQIQAA